MFANLIVFVHIFHYHCDWNLVFEASSFISLNNDKNMDRNQCFWLLSVDFFFSKISL